MRQLSVLILAFTVAATPVAFAQSSGDAGPRAAVEFFAGYAGFVDDATKDHAVAGGTARFHVTPRLSIGPEIVYMRGPGSDRDLFVTGNLTYDLAGRTSRVTPFLVAGAGWMRHSDTFGGRTFSSGEGAFTAGGGMRIRLTPGTFVIADARCGWELHCRISGGWGKRF